MTRVFRLFSLAGILCLAACHSCTHAGRAEKHLGADAVCAGGGDARLICNKGGKSYLCAVSFSLGGYHTACAPFTPVEAQ